MLLRVDGPAGHRNFILEPGATPLVAGRGTDADIRLPDTLRSISRRHLSFALEGEDNCRAVRVQVVSESLGAWSSQGELQPGSSSLLAVGEHLVIGEYRISVHTDVVAHSPVAAASPVPIPMPTSPYPATAPSAAAAPAAAPLSLDALLPPAAGEAPRESGPRTPHAADASRDLLDLILPREGAAPGLPELPSPRVEGQAFRVQPAPAEPARRGTRASGLTPDRNADAEGRAAVAHASGAPSEQDSPQDAVFDFLYGDRRAGTAAGPAPVDAPPETPLLIQMTPPDPQEWSDPAPSAAPWTPMGDVAEEPAAGPATDRAAGEASDPAGDLWSQLAHLAASVQSAPVTPLSAAPAGGEASAPAPPPAAPPESSAASRALAEGLGIELPDTLSNTDWVHVGATLRALVEGYASLLHTRDSVRSTLGVAGRTEVFSRDNNPLKLRVTPAMRLKLMALPQRDERRHLPANRAIAEATQDLQDHNMAIIAACRVAMEELVHSFDPARWESTEGGGKRLPILGEAQLWRRYREHYQQQTQHMADLIQRLFEQHFVNAYSRGLDRPGGNGKGAGNSSRA